LTQSYSRPRLRKLTVRRDSTSLSDGQRQKQASTININCVNHCLKKAF